MSLFRSKSRMPRRVGSFSALNSLSVCLDSCLNIYFCQGEFFSGAEKQKAGEKFSGLGTGLKSPSTPNRRFNPDWPGRRRQRGRNVARDFYSSHERFFRAALFSVYN